MLSPRPENEEEICHRHHIAEVFTALRRFLLVFWARAGHPPSTLAATRPRLAANRASAEPGRTQTRRTMSTTEYDVIVIGAGPVGENVADRTRAGGLSTSSSRRNSSGRLLLLGLRAVEGSAARRIRAQGGRQGRRGRRGHTRCGRNAATPRLVRLRVERRRPGGVAARRRHRPRARSRDDRGREAGRRRRHRVHGTPGGRRGDRFCRADARHPGPGRCANRGRVAMRRA